MTFISPKRSAHASIRGYLYQTCLGVLRWLQLGDDEVLVCEGDEDLDRLILVGTAGGVSEQVKALSGTVNVRDKVVAATLRQFLLSYVALRQRGETRRFLFTTTAQRRRQREGVDVLAAWNDPAERPRAIAFLRELFAAESDALVWLDAESGRWDGFSTPSSGLSTLRTSTACGVGSPSSWRRVPRPGGCRPRT